MSFVLTSHLICATILLVDFPKHFRVFVNLLVSMKSFTHTDHHLSVKNHYDQSPNFQEKNMPYNSWQMEGCEEEDSGMRALAYVGWYWSLHGVWGAISRPKENGLHF
jgi:hypothetical protein